MANAELIHPAAQELAIAIGSNLAEQTGFEAKHACPGEMVEHQAADLIAFGPSVAVMSVECNLLLGADELRRAVEQVHHHAAAAGDVELRLSHPCVRV